MLDLLPARVLTIAASSRPRMVYPCPAGGCIIPSSDERRRDHSLPAERRADIVADPDVAVRIRPGPGAAAVMRPTWSPEEAT